ncbi:hypothetical protein QJS10_CPA10g01340 [Acorus calamus]|uniref:Uncharacterized protein n=1 Tax=Acorus calamus TaxID=4465 RepID=A0AAV9E4N7_ACOCL|nr:hypothetical protein QJS10_CPA10g01340 [Acorus calamus]
MQEATLEYKLSDVIQDGRWHENALSKLLPPFWVTQILRTSPPTCHSETEDAWVWEGSTLVSPRIADVYNIIQPWEMTSMQKQWNRLWRIPDITPNAWNIVTRAVSQAEEYMTVLSKGSITLSTGTVKEIPSIEYQHQQCDQGSQGKQIYVLTDDSSQIIQLLNSHGEGPPQLRQLISQIKQLNEPPDPIVFSHVPREGGRRIDEGFTSTGWAEVVTAFLTKFPQLGLNKDKLREKFTSSASAKYPQSKKRYPSLQGLIIN